MEQTICNAKKSAKATTKPKAKVTQRAVEKEYSNSLSHFRPIKNKKYILFNIINET